MRTIGTLFVAGTFVLACSSKTGSGTGTTKADGSPAPGSGGSSASSQRTGGASGAGGIVGSGGTTASGGGPGQGGAIATGGATVTPDATSADGGADVAATDSPLTKPDSATVQGGAGGTGGTTATGGSSGTGGKGTIFGSGGTLGTGGSGATPGCTGAAGSGPIGTISGELATGIVFKDTDGKLVNAHGGGILQVCDTFYMHGEYFLSTTTDNNFNGFSMYSSKDLASWKNEGIVLPQQASGELGPNRKGERPHIIKCPSTGEFVLYAHAADSTYQVDKEVVYATSPSVNGKYTYKGPLTNASGTTASHSDMSAYADETGAYVITESGHVYTLASDCHSWLSDKSVAVNCTSGGSESPTVFKAGGTYYWIGSNKTGWRANNNFYSTASSMTGTWTCQGFIAPVTDTANDISDERTWLSQSTWVQPIVGSAGTLYLYWGDHWYGTQDTSNPGKHNDQATYVLQPIVFSSSTKMLLPTYLTTWKLDVGAGTWSQ
ncbi:MAG TPA: family 43 glycosylhydrolase [Polyangia bacterium]